MDIRKEFDRLARMLAIGGTLSLAACSSTQVMHNGLQVTTTQTPFTNTVRAGINTGAVHQGQVEALCVSPDGTLRRIGQLGAQHSTGDAAFRLQREQELAEAQRLAGVTRTQHGSIGACVIP